VLASVLLRFVLPVVVVIVLAGVALACVWFWNRPGLRGETYKGQPIRVGDHWW
jgi:hypothetical protein